MISSRKIGVITAIMICLAIAFSFTLVAFGNNSLVKSYETPDYTTKIFGSDIISIEIVVNEDDWILMLENAINEQFIMVDVIVNGTKFEKVSIRPKGNSSLSSVARDSDNNRYSFRLQFDEYIKDQTCFGLDSFVVNNMLGDNTYMKEYVSYEMMKEIGVNSPYFAFADIKVNGEGWGLYLAVEAYGDSYEIRTYGTTSGMIYNVKSMDIGGGFGDRDEMSQDGGFPGGGEMPQDGGFPGGGEIPQDGGFPGGGEIPQDGGFPSGGEMPQDGGFSNGGEMLQDGGFPSGGEMSQGGFGGRGMGGGSLEYTDDKSSSYSSIFGNVVGKGSESDYQEVIEALKALSEGKDLEEYFDVDGILRYLAAHTIVVNLDSYSSTMAQNYYLYEEDGKVTILPWDYNLAWGGFQSGSASSIINFPIDTPVNGVEMDNRPLISKLFANSEYLEKYNSYLQEIMTNYFADGKWEAKINELDALITSYVQNDNTAFCTYEEYKKSLETFKTLGNLRYQSIQGQLDGTVPSTTAKQKENADMLISDDGIVLSTLGTMGRGGFGGRGGNEQDGDQIEDMLDMEFMQKAMEIIQAADGTLTDEVKEKLKDLGLTDDQMVMFSQFGANGDRTQDGFEGEIPNGNGQEQNRNFGRPNGVDFTPEAGNQTQELTNNFKNVALYGGSILLLLVTIFFISRKKRKY